MGADDLTLCFYVAVSLSNQPYDMKMCLNSTQVNCRPNISK